MEHKMQNNKFYMQIHRLNLVDYINKAIISPSKYILDRTEEDIQSKNEDFILLSDGYFEELNENQVLIEIVLTEEEVKSLENITSTSTLDFKNTISTSSILNTGYYLCELPLPITRITNIYFNSKERIKKYQSEFHIGDVGYLPNDRLRILSQTFKKKLTKYSIPSSIKNNKDITWSSFSKTKKIPKSKKPVQNSDISTKDKGKAKENKSNTKKRVGNPFEIGKFSSFHNAKKQEAKLRFITNKNATNLLLCLRLEDGTDPTCDNIVVVTPRLELCKMKKLNKKNVKP